MIGCGGMERTIAVLTSGGDAPGMNAAIRAVVRKGIYCGFKVYGIKRGYEGLINGEFVELKVGSVGGIVQRGGTMLMTARSEEMLTAAGQNKATAQLKDKKIDGLVVIGGDGSFRGAQTLSQRGINVVGIPGTIDNDISGTDLTIGFDTAVNTVLDAVAKIRDTAASHERIFVVEVMGRERGSIALQAGLACGAESILVPEIPFSLQEVAEKLLRGRERGKKQSIIMVAEGAGSAYQIGKQLQADTGLEIRVTILGHIQRGGNPSAVDLLLGATMGGKAVEILLNGESDRMTAYQGREVVSCPMEVAYTPKVPLDRRMYDLANQLGI